MKSSPSSKKPDELPEDLKKELRQAAKRDAHKERRRADRMDPRDYLDEEYQVSYWDYYHWKDY